MCIMPTRWLLVPTLLCLLVSLARCEPSGPAEEGNRAPAKRTDVYGDPLPEGAIARLGTARFRQQQVHAVAFSPDGNYIASGGYDRSVRLWDAATGRAVRTFPGHGAWVYALAFSPDGRVLVSGGAGDGRLRFWEVESGRLIRTCLGDPRAVYALAFAPTGKVVAAIGSDGVVHCWEAATGKHLRTCAGSPGVVRRASVAFSPDGNLVAAGDSRDGVVRLWEVATGKSIRTWKAHDDEVTAVAFSPNGKALATSNPYSSAVVRLWDVATGKQIRSWDDDAWALAFSPNGKILAAGNVHSLELWNPATGKRIVPRVKKSDGFFALAFAPDGRTLACGGNDNMVSLYDVATGRLKPTDKGHRNNILALAFSPDSRVVATTSLDHTLRLWEAATGRLLHVCNGHRNYVNAVAFSPDGKIVASGGEDWTVRTWEVATGKQLQVWKTPPYWHFGKILFASGGKVVAVVTDYRSIQVLDVATGKATRTTVDPDHRVYGMEVSPDGRALAFGASVDELGLWRPGTGKPIHIWKVPKRGINTLTFSPDGRILISEKGSEGIIRFWDATTGRPLRSFRGDKQCVGVGAFSPDGRVMVSQGGDDLCLWEIVTGQVIRTWKHGHQAGGGFVAFAPDGRTVASVGRDMTVLIWDAYNLREGTLPPPRPSTEDLPALWSRLGGKAKDAYSAIVLLSQVPKASVPLLKRRVRPTGPVTADRLKGLIADLDDHSFATREAAHAELAKLAELAEPALRGALAGRPSAEQRQRIEDVLKRIADIAASPERLRGLRAVTALEWAGTPEARDLLRVLTKGAPAARLTREAKASLERLAKRPTPPAK